MATNPSQPLIDFQPTHEFFIGIDSDGCAFDTMEIKHKECFIPNIIKHFGLQAISKYARQAGEFVNLYSKWRGVNRFPALEMVLDLLTEHPEIARRGVTVPKLEAMRQWLATESKPGNPALITAIEASNDGVCEELKQVLAWSEAVNQTIDDMVSGVPPFPFVRESLEKASSQADMIVVSATPNAALEKEWAEHDIAKYTRVIAGQEMGKKAEHLTLAAKGRYPSDHILMIGDAIGDMKAARAVGALFYPINPGDEATSWQRLYDEAMDRFFAGTYKGEYESELIKEFDAHLPELPPWKAERSA